MDWNYYNKINNVNNSNFNEHWIKYNNLINEKIATSSTSSSSAGGHLNSYFNLYFETYNVSDPDSINLYFETSDNSNITINWEDGVTDVIESDNSDSHSYDNIGEHIVNILPLNISTISIFPSNLESYKVIKKIEYQLLTNLINLWIISDIIDIEANALDNTSLQFLGLKYSNLTTLKNSMFNGISTLNGFYLINCSTVTSFESGVFKGLSNLQNLEFYSTPFINTDLVDNFLIDLNNSKISNCNITIDLTNRTSNSDFAALGLEFRGCSVNITRQ